MESGRIQRLLAAVMTLVMIWYVIPEWQRQQIRMWVMARSREAFGTAARMEGRRGMGDELAGRHGEAARRYGVAYNLSRLRDAAGRAYESIRP